MLDESRNKIRLASLVRKHRGANVSQLATIYFVHKFKAHIHRYAHKLRLTYVSQELFSFHF